MALDGHSVRGLDLPARAPPVTLVAARYMFDGPSVIAGRLPALICCLSSIDMADRRVLVMMDN